MLALNTNQSTNQYNVWQPLSTGKSDVSNKVYIPGIRNYEKDILTVTKFVPFSKIFMQCMVVLHFLFQNIFHSFQNILLVHLETAKYVESPQQ